MCFFFDDSTIFFPVSRVQKLKQRLRVDCMYDSMMMVEKKRHAISALKSKVQMKRAVFSLFYSIHISLVFPAVINEKRDKQTGLVKNVEKLVAHEERKCIPCKESSLRPAIFLKPLLTVFVLLLIFFFLSQFYLSYIVSLEKNTDWDENERN